MNHFKRSFIKEVYNLTKTVDQDFDNQVKLLDLDDYQGNSVSFKITPNTGPYAHATFKFTLQEDTNYPDKCPIVISQTPILHPNIDYQPNPDNVCMNILNEWNRRFGIKDLIHSLIHLLNEPNIEDSLRYGFTVPHGLTYQEYVNISLGGAIIEGITYPPNKSWCEWMKKNAKENFEKNDANQKKDITVASLPDHLPSTSSTIPQVSKQLSTESKQQLSPLILGQFSPIGSIISNIHSYVPKCDIYFYFITIEQLTTSERNDNSNDSSICRYYIAQKFYCGYCYDEFRLIEHVISMQHLNLVDGKINLPQRSWIGTAEYRNENDMQTDNKIESESTSSEIQSEEPTKYDQTSEESFNKDNSRTEESSNPFLWDELPLDNVSNEDNKSKEDNEKYIKSPSRSNSHSSSSSNLSSNPFLWDELPMKDVSSYEDQSSTEKECRNFSELTESEESNCSLHSNNSLGITCDVYEYMSKSAKKVKQNRWAKFYYTRWPPNIAPGQFYHCFAIECMSIEPFIRASCTLLRRELSILASDGVNENEILILVDPLALSPCSPIFNRIVRVSVPDEHIEPNIIATFQSTEWLSVSWTMLPPPNKEKSKDLSIPCEFGLASLCWLSNWLAYLSRMEIYHSCLGYSRKWKSDYLDNFALACLTPACMSYGQCPMFDAWPLWLVTNLTRLLSSCLLQASAKLSSKFEEKRIRLYYAFSDVDEI